MGSLPKHSSAGSTHPTHQPAASQPRHIPWLTRGFYFPWSPAQQQREGNPRPPSQPTPLFLALTHPASCTVPGCVAGNSRGTRVRARGGKVLRWRQRCGAECQSRPRCTPGHGSQPHRAVILCAFAPEETPKIIPSSAESVGVYTHVNNPRPGCWLGRGHTEGVPEGERHTQGTGEQEHTAGCRPRKHPPPAPCRGTRAGSIAWDARRLLRCPGLPGSLWLCTSPCAPQAP